MRILIPQLRFAFWFTLCLLPATRSTAQLRLTSVGAMTALNATVVTTPPSSAPLNNMVAVPAPGSLATVPAAGPIGQVNYQSTIPNDRSLTFAYQSALAWWSGYNNYEQAAQSLNFSGGNITDITMAISAANYILAGGVFTQFQNYSPRRATMVMKANDQSPVHFPKLQEVNNATVQLNMYTPVVSSYSYEIPISF